MLIALGATPQNNRLETRARSSQSRATKSRKHGAIRLSIALPYADVWLWDWPCKNAGSTACCERLIQVWTHLDYFMRPSQPLRMRYCLFRRRRSAFTQPRDKAVICIGIAEGLCLARAVLRADAQATSQLDGACAIGTHVCHRSPGYLSIKPKQRRSCCKPANRRPLSGDDSSAIWRRVSRPVARQNHAIAYRAF